MIDHARNLPFSSSILEALPKGVVDLGVPVLQDVIQIRADKVDGSTRTVVDRHKSDVSITRMDGAPIQVHINPGPWDEDYARPGAKSAARPVFVDPIDKLILSLDRSSGLWTPTGEGVEAASTQDLVEFTFVVAQYALRKQVDRSRARFSNILRSTASE